MRQFAIYFRIVNTLLCCTLSKIYLLCAFGFHKQAMKGSSRSQLLAASYFLLTQLSYCRDVRSNSVQSLFQL